MGDYRYPDTPASGVAHENPQKKDDHGPEALGRFFRGYYGSTVGQGGRAHAGRGRCATGGEQLLDILGEPLSL